MCYSISRVVSTASIKVHLTWTAVLVLLMLCTAGSTRAEIGLGSRGALAFGLDAQAEYDSNINLNSDEDDDMIGTALPKLMYRYNQGAVYVDAFVGMEFRRYEDQTQYDSENFKSRFSVEYPYGTSNANYEVKLDGGYNESTSADSDLQTVVEKETTTLNVSGRYFFAERYYLRSAVRYQDTETVTEGFDDVKTVTVPIDFFYRYSENLSYGLGYRFRDTTVDGSGPSADSKDHAVYAAVEGRLTPTIDSEIRLGAQRREFSESSFEDDDGFFAETLVSWSFSTQSVLELSAGSEFNTSAATQSIDKKYLGLELKHRFDEKLSARASVGYEDREYIPLAGGLSRNDEELYVRMGAEYILIQNRLTLNGSIFQSDQSSDRAESEYSQTVALIGLSLIY